MWNFGTWQCRGYGPNAGAERQGMVWETGPGSISSAETLEPFTNGITVIFAFLLRDGWTSVTGNEQGLFGIGMAQDSDLEGFSLSLVSNELRILGYDLVTRTTRYDVSLGDEDGVSSLQTDKWYQVGVSCFDIGLNYCVNGSTTPKLTTVTNAPGDLNLDRGDVTDPQQQRVWVHGSRAAHSQANPGSITSGGWPSTVMGPAMMTNLTYNFNDASQRARIWDANGDFINPGENGSLWYSDEYTTSFPLLSVIRYFPVGVPVLDNGETQNLDWGRASAGNSGTVTPPGGLRKQYE